MLPLLLSANLVSCSGADASGSGASSGGGMNMTLMMLLMLGLMIVLFVVMSIPQRKREKKVKEMLDALKPGDRVRTIGGIYGTVTSIKDDVVTLSVGPDKARLVFARGAIATIEDAPVETTIDGEVKDVK
ncbi:MAG: preprotein translocase subunit YajC [Clostridia bacterium]|nr:preprotein translocase subunit YajC [Clostridia bacterium]